MIKPVIKQMLHGGWVEGAIRGWRTVPLEGGGGGGLHTAWGGMERRGVLGRSVGEVCGQGRHPGSWLGHWVAGGTMYLHWDTGRGARWKRDDPPLWMCWDTVPGGQGERPGGSKGLAAGSALGERGGKV